VRIRTGMLLAATVVATSLPTAALASSERMQLPCGGELGTIERSNGNSWWGQDGTVYTTAYIRVSEPTEDVTYHEKRHGSSRPHETVTCDAVAPSGLRWQLELVPAGKR